MFLLFLSFSWLLHSVGFFFVSSVPYLRFCLLKMYEWLTPLHSLLCMYRPQSVQALFLFLASLSEPSSLTGEEQMSC